MHQRRAVLVEDEHLTRHHPFTREAVAQARAEAFALLRVAVPGPAADVERASQRIPLAASRSRRRWARVDRRLLLRDGGRFAEEVSMTDRLGSFWARPACQLAVRRLRTCAIRTLRRFLARVGASHRRAVDGDRAALSVLRRIGGEREHGEQESKN